MSLKTQEIFDLIYAADRQIQHARDYDFRARNIFYQEATTVERIRGFARGSSLFFDIVKRLNSYFFSQLPEVLVGATPKNELTELRRAILEDFANELSTDRDFFHAIKNSILNCLLGGIGIYYCKPVFEEGKIVKIVPTALSLQDVAFDPRVNFEELPFICVREHTTILKLEKAFGQELALNDKTTPSVFYFFFDFANQELVVLTPLASKELLRVPFLQDKEKLSAKDLFSSLTFAPVFKTHRNTRFLDMSETLPITGFLPYVSLYRVLEVLLRNYDQTLSRYLNLLENIRHIGIVDSSVRDLIRAIETAEEGQLVAANLIAFLNQSKGTDLIYTLPIERLIAGLQQLANSLIELQAQIYERAGIPEIQSATKITAENIMQITPYLIDANYASFIKDIDYFIADCYKNYLNFLLRISPNNLLLEKIVSVLDVQDYQTQLRMLNDLTTLRTQGMRFEVATETLSFNRLEKHKIQIKELIEQQIAGISQVVNSLSASPEVGAAIAQSLVELSGLYKLGRRQKAQLQQAFVNMVNSFLQQAQQQSAIDENLLRFRELELREKELAAEIQLKEKELLLKQKQLELASIQSQLKGELNFGKQEIERLQIELQAKKLEIDQLKQEIEAQKASINFEVEKQRLELERMRTEIESINKISDNARLEQEARIKSQLNALQIELMQRILSQQAQPTINITNQLPARKKIVFNPTESGLIADVSELSEPQPTSTNEPIL